MAENQNFRSAFNGFNREDVVHYIEYLNSKHTAEVNQLKSEVEYLQDKASQESSKPQDADPVIEQQAARIRELFDQCQAQEQEITALKAENEKLAAELEAAQQQNNCSYRMEEELEAYRRAERTERVARERAELIYHQTNGALADATVKVDSAAAQIGELADQVMQQLSQLQSAVTGSKDALTDASSIMYSIRSNS